MSSNMETKEQLQLSMRAMVHNDFGPVMAIWNACFADDPEFAFFPERIWIERYLKSMDPYKVYRVATPQGRDSQILGVVSYSRRDDHLHLRKIFVDPRHQRRGVGRALLNYTALMAWKGRRTFVAVDVIEWRQPMHYFLRACGFRATVPLIHDDHLDVDFYRFVRPLERND